STWGQVTAEVTWTSGTLEVEATMASLPTWVTSYLTVGTVKFDGFVASGGLALSVKADTAQIPGFSPQNLYPTRDPTNTKAAGATVTIPNWGDVTLAGEILSGGNFNLSIAAANQIDMGNGWLLQPKLTLTQASLQADTKVTITGVVTDLALSAKINIDGTYNF